MRRQRNDARRRGATLVLVTTIGVIVAILSLSMIQIGYEARVLAVRDTQKVEAREAADAGLAEALMRMQEALIRAHANHVAWTGPVGPGSGTLAGTNASYDYHVDTLTGAFGGYYQIVSTGSCGTATKTVNGVLDLESYMEGIGVDKTLDAKNSTYFGFVGGGTIQDMKVRSNSTDNDAMIFRTNVRVDGDVFCGPGGVPSNVVEVKQNVMIAGQVGASSYTMVWPPISIPNNLVTTGPSLMASTTLPYGRYQYGGSLIIPNSVTIYIDPDPSGAGNPTVLYVPEMLSLGQSSEIIVKAGAKLEIYVGHELRCGNATGFGNENSYAASLKIFGLPTCTYIDLKTKSDTYASVYAPNADLDLYNSGNFLGAIVADSFEMKNSGNFFFDTRLATVNINDLLARFVISRWWES